MKIVDVGKIAEYPLKFGSPGCHLLVRLGIDFYMSTPEMIMDVLKKSAADPDKLAICKSGYCGTLLDL